MTVKSKDPKLTSLVAPVYGTPEDAGEAQLATPEAFVVSTCPAILLCAFGYVTVPAVMVPLVFTFVIAVDPGMVTPSAPNCMVLFPDVTA